MTQASTAQPAANENTIADGVSRFISAHPKISLAILIVLGILILALAVGLVYSLAKGRPLKLWILEINRDAGSESAGMRLSGSSGLRASGERARHEDAVRASVVPPLTSDQPGDNSPPAGARKKLLRECARLHEAVAESLDYHVNEIVHRLVIKSDYSTVAETIVEFEPNESAVGVVSQTRSSRTSSLKSFLELQFEAELLDAANAYVKKLPWLPAKDKPNEKSLLVFLCPPALPGSSPVRLRFRCQWPNGAAELSEVESPSELTIGAAARLRRPVRQVRLVVQSELQESLRATIHGREAILGGRGGVPEFVFEASDVAPGKAYTVSLERFS